MAAVIQPKGWKDKGFQLSSQATEGFKDSYPKKDGAFAISPSGGGWGRHRGRGGAGRLRQAQPDRHRLHRGDPELTVTPGQGGELSPSPAIRLTQVKAQPSHRRQIAPTEDRPEPGEPDEPL
ncbi:MAG: hypothetical protein HZT43_11735 [Exiguobacterium profundum]|nr:MAG: hypothetical protein HZT43_11735 [Exiguobacterium profundum]